MNSENLIPKKLSSIDSMKTGAVYGLIFSVLALFAIYFVTKIVLA